MFYVKDTESPPGQWAMIVGFYFIYMSVSPNMCPEDEDYPNCVKKKILHLMLVSFTVESPSEFHLWCCHISVL